MHRLNLTIDESLYEQVRAVSFIEKKSISQMIRESLSEYIEKNSKTKQQANLILEADDEKEILSILANDEFTSNEDFKSKFNLWKYRIQRHLKRSFPNMIENFKKKYSILFKTYQMEMLKDWQEMTYLQFYRVRVSKYRILFHMSEEEIQILKVDSRGDVYK